MHVYNNSTLSRSGLNFCNVTKRSLSYLLSLHQESRDRSFGIDFTFLAHFCTWTFFILNNLILFYLHLYVIMNRYYIFYKMIFDQMFYSDLHHKITMNMLIVSTSNISYDIIIY